MRCRIGRQFHIYPWLININGGAALKQPVWYGDVATAIRKYCMNPEAYNGKIMELGGPEVMAWSQIVDWFREVTHTARVPPRTQHQLLVCMLECWNWVQNPISHVVKWTCV